MFTYLLHYLRTLFPTPTPLLPVLNKPYGFCGRQTPCLLMCESCGGHPGLPVPNSHHGLCGRKTTVEEEEEEDRIVLL